MSTQKTDPLQPEEERERRKFVAATVHTFPRQGRTEVELCDTNDSFILTGNDSEVQLRITNDRIQIRFSDNEEWQDRDNGLLKRGVVFRKTLTFNP